MPLAALLLFLLVAAKIHDETQIKMKKKFSHCKEIYRLGENWNLDLKKVKK